jgi:site-specific DNA recombinase
LPHVRRGRRAARWLELVLQIKQAVAEHARRQASYRTRRGLEGNAIAGKPTGGRAYGYTAARDGVTGQVEIDEAQASVVRRIFEMFADGHSRPRSAATSIAARLVNNRRYLGIVVWGRSEWKRSAADSRKRRHRLLAAGSAHERTDERLRIISDELWQRVKARQRYQNERSGKVVKTGQARRRRAGGGPASQYPLSGLLRCAACEASFSSAALSCTAVRVTTTAAMPPAASA